jgi:hypothetical protein
MKQKITTQRLLELGCSLNGIIEELLVATGGNEPIKKSNNEKIKRRSRFENHLDSKKIKNPTRKPTS